VNKNEGNEKGNEDEIFISISLPLPSFSNNYNNNNTSQWDPAYTGSRKI